MTNGDKERYRVQAAIAAMQGILANPSNSEFGAFIICEMAVFRADALMA